MSERVVLFIDYQNAYMGARTCFHKDLKPHHTCGQISPLQLGLHLAEAGLNPRELTQVRVYRGRPDASKDPTGYGACTRQTDIWQQDPRVKAVLRTLRYPRGWPGSSSPGEKPQEKGIDVALAIDFVRLALEDQYDVGVLMSTDTDLKPALETVSGFRAQGKQVRVEVAAWSGDDMHNRRLSIPGRQLWCHWLNKDVYSKVQDLTSYS